MFFELLIFFTFFLSVLGLGLWIVPREEGTLLSTPKNSAARWVLALALGSAFYALVFGGLTAVHFPPIGVLRVVFIVLLLFGIGFLIHSIHSGKGLRWERTPQDRFAQLFLLLCGLHVFLKCVEATQLHPHGDAYVAYLRGPQLALSAGGWSPLRSAPVLFLATSWESFFSWGLLHFQQGANPGSVSLEMLARFQRFAQLCTALVANGGLAGVTFLWVRAVLKRLHPQFSRTDTVAGLAAFVALSVPHLRWTAHLAKHDLGVAFWLLTGFLLLWESRGNLPVFLGAVLLGVASIGKLSVGPALVVFLFLLLLQDRAWRQPVRWLGLLVGGLVGAGPWLLRNFAATGNPLYPFANGFFGSTWAAPSQVAETGRALGWSLPSFSELGWRMFEYVSQFPPSIGLAAALPLFAFQFRRAPQKLKWFGFVALNTVLCVVLFSLLLRGQTEIRYNLSGLIFWNVSTVCFIAITLLILSEEDKTWVRIVSKLSFVGLMFWILSTSHLSLHTLAKWVKGKLSNDIQSQILRHNSGPAKIWILENIPTGQKVLTLGDQELYYLAPYQLIPIEESPDLEKSLLALWASKPGGHTDSFNADILLEAMTIFSNSGAQWIYIDRNSYMGHAGNYYQSITAIRPEIWAECLAFQSEDAWVVRLPCVAEGDN